MRKLGLTLIAHYSIEFGNQIHRVLSRFPDGILAATYWARSKNITSDIIFTPYRTPQYTVTEAFLRQFKVALKHTASTVERYRLSFLHWIIKKPEKLLNLRVLDRSASSRTHQLKMVPRAGIEPAHRFRARDFKSRVSTSFTTEAN